LIKGRVKLSAEDYGLQIYIYINNLYPEYYPIEFDISEDLLEEIYLTLNSDVTNEQSQECKSFFEVYSSLENIGDILFASFYNFEREKDSLATVKNYYESPEIMFYEGETENVFHAHVPNDTPLYLKEFMNIKSVNPQTVICSYTDG